MLSYIHTSSELYRHALQHERRPQGAGPFRPSTPWQIVRTDGEQKRATTIQPRRSNLQRLRTAFGH